MPASGPASGRSLGPLLADGVHRAVGAAINVTVTGVNLGRSGALKFAVYDDSDPASVDIDVPAASIVAWSDAAVTFAMPPGYGDKLRVTAVVGGQASSQVVVFGYDPPTVLNVTRADRQPVECRDRQAFFTFGDAVYAKSVPAGCFDTRGAFPLEVIGQSLGRTAAEVTVGGRPCPLSAAHAQFDDVLVCTAPQGYGDANEVVVRVGRRASPRAPGAVLAYDPPQVYSLMPNTPSALGEPVMIRGKNFGWERSPVTITISGLECNDPQWLNDGALSCTPQPDVVGPKNVSVLVANRTQPYTLYDYEQVFVTECKKDYYGLDGEECLDCEKHARGAVCPGGEHTVDKIYSDLGWWRVNLTQPNPLCDAKRAGRAACPYFVPCGPPESCLGNNTCALGYEGDRCAFCLKGKYYRVNGECIKCPDSPWAVLLIMLCGALAALGVSHCLNKYKITLALIAIGIDYFQIVSMFSKTRIRWPAALKEVFRVLSAFNLNLELVAPECALPEVTFTKKWAFFEMIPIFAAAILSLIYAARFAWKKTCLNKTREQQTSHLPNMVSIMIVMYRVLYLNLTRMTLDVFNCTPTDPPDGKEYMAGMLDVVCGAPGSAQTILLPFAVFTLIGYSLGLPALGFWFLRRKRSVVKYDQILRAKGMGETKFDNPKYYRFRKMWHMLYYHFKPGKWYWELVVIGTWARAACQAWLLGCEFGHALLMAVRGL
jgi:hypothetical protein